ncbi:MAG: histidine kinase [Lachnospiraceae bacterium]|nr:histidine kinase [Robinsoniella sp.]MDY3767593.1 histidine kinase [Lachnospiraceae bacterium]
MLRIHPGFATQKPADSSVPEEKYSPFQYLRTKMILWILVFLLPILILLCVSMHRILDSYSNQMTANHSQSLRQYTADIDAELAAAKRILYSENVSLDVLRREPGSDLETLENMKFWGDILVDDLKTQENLDAFFLYDNGKTLFIQNYNTSYAENRKMADTLTKYLVENQDQLFESSGNYQAIKTEDDYYLYLGYEADGGIFGCWFSVERLLKNICDSDLQGMVDAFLSLPNGTALSSAYDFMDEDTLQETFSPYCVTNQELSGAPFSLTVLWDKDVVYQTLYETQRLIAYIMILAFVLFIAYLAFLSKTLFIPLRQLTENIDRLGTEMSEPLKRSGKESVEFKSIYNALIAMTREISDLRIDVYEKELLQQKTQLELYQLQIRPHFFLNVLNTIQCLTRKGNMEKAEGMVEMLTCHCRYVLYSSQFVLLDEELNFIRNYIQLQEILHSRQYHLSIECPEELLDYEIPVLMIQILVENTIKHAGGEQIPLEIRICVSKEKKAENSCMKIAVSDNGRGFPEEVLQKLRDTDSIHQPGEGHGIGIDNIRRRLHLIYGDTAIIIFKNEPEGGTMVEMEIPVSHL